MNLGNMFIIKILVQIVFFILMRYATILMAFLMGFGGGGHSKVFLGVYIFIPALLLQVLSLGRKILRKADVKVSSGYEFYSIVIIVILFLCSAFGIIPNSFLLPT